AQLVGVPPGPSGAGPEPPAVADQVAGGVGEQGEGGGEQVVGLVQAEGGGQVEPGGDLLLEVVAQQGARPHQGRQVRVLGQVEAEGLLGGGGPEGPVPGEGDQDR